MCGLAQCLNESVYTQVQVLLSPGLLHGDYFSLVLSQFLPPAYDQPVQKRDKEKKDPPNSFLNWLPCDCWAFYPGLAPLHQNQQMSQFCPFWGQIHT